MRSRALSATPRQVALVTLALAFLFVGFRFAFAVDTNIAGFVDAASHFVDKSKVDIPVFDGEGYDGQFVYRLAIDPLDFSETSHGITVDNNQRFQRIGLPGAAWMVTLGHDQAIPTVLVLINAFCIALLAYFSAEFAVRFNKPAVYGLLVAMFFGFAITIGRDLTELLAAAFVVGGILAFEKRNTLASALFFSAAVITRETSLAVPFSIGLYALLQIFRTRQVKQYLVYALPALASGAAFVSWQLFVYSRIGEIPLSGGSGKNSTVPFKDLLPAIPRWIEGLSVHPGANALLLLQFTALVLIVVLAALELKSSTVPPYLKIAFGVSMCLAVSLSTYVWSGPADFRTLSDLYIVSMLVLIGSKVPAAAWAAATSATVATFGVRVFVR